MSIKNRELTEESSPIRARRKRSEPKLYISFLPEGRGGPKEDKGSVPLEVEVESHIEERTDCEPGLYRIEKKRSGEFSGEVLFYSKDDVSNFEPSSAIGEFADDRQEHSETDIRRIVATTVSATLEARERRDRATMGQPDPMETFRQMRALLKEEREEMQHQMAGASGQQQDPLAMFERVVELHKKLQPDAPEPEDALTAKDRAHLMLVKETGIIPEFMKSMREMLRAPENAVEPKSMVEKAVDYLATWTPYVAPVVGPVIGGKVAELLSRVDTTAIAQRMSGPKAQTPTVGAPGATPPSVHQASVNSNAASAQSQQFQEQPQQPSAEDLLAMEAFDVVVNEMRLYDEEPDDTALNEPHIQVAADALQKLPPHLLQQIVAAPSAFLVANLSQLHPSWADVADLANATGFVNQLKLEVTQRLEAPAPTNPSAHVSAETDLAGSAGASPAAITPSVNGTKPAATVGS